MKILPKIFLDVFCLSVFLPTLANATLFQNSDANCEQHLVVCSSSPNCSGGGAESMACRNPVQGADFNGDGFIDCAAGKAIGLSPPTLSVLLNNGAGAICGVGPGQFSDSLDYGLSGLFNAGSLSSGTLVVGDLDGTADTDLCALRPVTPKNMATAFNPGGGFGPDESILSTDDVLWSVDPDQSGFPSFADRGQVLFDCDGDGDLDSANTARSVINFPVGPGQLFTTEVNILRNDGSGLVAINDPGLPGSTHTTGFTGLISPPPLPAPILVSTLAVDFFEDGNTTYDIAALVSITGTTAAPSAVFMCRGDGNCGYPSPCEQVIDLNNQAPHAGTNPNPFSIASGDFNEDGIPDIVISEPGLPPGQRGVHYFFGIGDGHFDQPGVHVNFTGGPIDGIPRVVTTGCFNNDNVVDVATTYSNLAPTTGSSDVRVITSDGSGGLNPVLTLSFNGVVPPGSFVNLAAGIDAADFDGAGGDDLMALASVFAIPPERNAFLFMNTIENFFADAGPDQTAESGVGLALSGDCLVSPDDPTNPTTFAVEWTATPAAGVTLTDAETLTPIFLADQPGTYTLTLACTSRCTSTVTDTMVVTVPGVSPAPTPTSGPVPPPGSSTQGGCLTNRLAGETVDGSWMWGGLGLMGLLWLLHRRQTFR